MYQNRGCSKAKRTHLQVYRYNDVTRSAAQLSAKYLFDKTHQMNNKKSEIHTLQLIKMSINITRHYLDSDDVIRNSLNKNWNYLGAIKESKYPNIIMVPHSYFLVVWARKFLLVCGTLVKEQNNVCRSQVTQSLWKKCIRLSNDSL